MPEDQTIDPIQEVLEVRADPSTFAESLVDVEQVWNAFLERLGSENAAAVIGAGIFESLQKLSQSIEVFSENVNKSLENTFSRFDKLTGNLEATAAEADQVANAAEAAQRQRNLDKVKDAENTAVSIKTAYRSMQDSERVARTNERTTDAGAKLKANDQLQAPRADGTPSGVQFEERRTPQQENLRDINSGIQGAQDSRQESLDAQYAKVVGQIENEIAAQQQAGRVGVQTAEEQSAALKELQEQYAQVLEMLERLAQPQLRIGTDENAITNARAYLDTLQEKKALQESILALQERANAQRKLANDIGDEQEGIVNVSEDAARAKQEAATAQGLQNEIQLREKLRQQTLQADADEANSRASYSALIRKLAQEEVEAQAKFDQQSKVALESNTQARIKAASVDATGDNVAQTKLWADRLREVNAQLEKVKPGAEAFRGGSRNAQNLSDLQEETRLNNQATEAEAKLKAASTRSASESGQEATLQERYAAAVERTAQAYARLQVTSARTNTNDVVEGLRNQLGLVDQQIAKTKANLESLQGSGSFQVSGKPSEENVAGQKQAASLLSQLNTLQREHISITEQLRSETEGFWGKIAGEIDNAFNVAVKFTVAYRAVNLIMEAGAEAIAAPFKALRDGVQYLTDLQNKTEDLSAVIAANIGYSKDQAENFRLSQQVGSAAMQSIQDKAIEARVPVENLTKTVKALLEAKASGTVKSMQDVIDMAGMMQGIIEHLAPKGNFGVGNFEKSVEELFNGTAKQDNLFLKTTNTTVAAWEKMVQEGKEHGDLLTQMASKFKPYLDEVGQAQLSFSVMKEQLELTIKRIEGAAAGPLFATLSSVLADVNAWLKNNKSAMEEGLRVIGDLLQALLDLTAQFIKLGQTFHIFDFLTGALGTGVLLIQSFASGTADLFDTISTGFRITLAAMTADFAQVAKLSDELEKRRAQRVASLADTAADVYDLSGRPGHGKDAHTDQDKKNKDALSQKAPPKGPDLQTPANTAKQDFSEAKAEFQENMDLVKRAADEAKAHIQEMVADGEISHRTALQDITAINKQELAAMQPFITEVLRKTKAARAEIANNTAIPQVDKDRQLKEFDAQQKNLQRQIFDAQQNVDKSTHGSRRDANKEQLEIDLEAVKQRYALLQQESEQEKELVQQAAKENRFTKLDEFDAEAEIEKLAHANTIKDLDEEIARKKVKYGEDTVAATVAYQELVDKKASAEQAWSAKLELMERQRSEVAYQQMLQQQERENALRQERIHSEQTNVDLRKSVEVEKGAVTDDGQQAVLDLRQKDIDLQTKQTEAALVIARSRNAESDETAKLTDQLEKLRNARTQLLQDEINDASSNAQTQDARQIIARGVIARHQKQTDEDVTNTSIQIDGTRNELSQTSQDLDKAKNELAASPDNPLLDEEVTNLQDRVSKLNSELDKLRQHLSDLNEDQADQSSARRAATPSWDKFFQNAEGTLLGKDFHDKLDNARDEVGAQGTVDTAATIAGGAVNVVGDVQQSVGQFKKGEQKGGTAGGIGSLLQSGPLSEALSAIPVVGAFVKPIGVALSLIGDAFTARAKAIAEQIKTEFDNTKAAISNGTIGPGAGIQMIGQQEQSAITRLSGVKDGSAQLNKILPEMAQELQQLVSLQQQSLVQFQQQLQTAQLQSDTLSQINQEWLGINQTVAQYINNGGSAAQATQMLQLSLQQIERQAGQELTQGYQSAVKDALQLNQLAQQRYNLELQEKHQEFDLVNADSVERMQAGAVVRGQQLQQQRAQYQQQLDDLNSQINIENDKVNAESQIFNLAKSISELHRQDDQLTIAALDVQLQKYKDLQNAVTSINGGSQLKTGNTGLSSQLASLNAAMVQASSLLQQDISKGKKDTAAYDTSQIEKLNEQIQQTATALMSSAGGSLLNTGQEGPTLQAIQQGLAALQAQVQYATAHSGSGPWANDLAGYLTGLNNQITSLTNEQARIMNTAPQIGTNPTSANTGILNLGNLSSILNDGLSGNQSVPPIGSTTPQVPSTASFSDLSNAAVALSNPSISDLIAQMQTSLPGASTTNNSSHTNITLTVNIPANANPTQISNSIMQELNRQFRQSPTSI